MERYALTLPISDATVALVQRKGGDLTKPEDIKGKTVGIQKGTAQEKQLEAYSDTLGGFTIRGYGSPDEAYADLAAGRLDAVAGSAPNLAYLAKTRPDVFETIQPPFGEPKYFAWVTRKDGSESLIEAMNAALIKIQDDGRLAAMQEKWFGTATALPKEMPAM